LNIANFLTLMRLLLVPVFAIFFVQGKYLEAIAVFVFCGITDIVDGYIARKFNMITNFGKLMDPIADKVLQITALVLLTVVLKLNIIFVMVFGIKELAMFLGSAYLYKKKVVVFSNWYGKAATVVLFAAVFANILAEWQPQYYQIDYAAHFLIWVALGATLTAFVAYIYEFVVLVKRKD